MMTLEDIPTIENEQWKPVEGFDHYFVSDKGRVMSLRRLSVAKILKPQIQTAGYQQVQLMKEDPNGEGMKRFNRTVHKLVAVHFVEGYEDGKVVQHVNGNILDNVSDNLRWVTLVERRKRHSKLTSST